MHLILLCAHPSYPLYGVSGIGDFRTCKDEKQRLNQLKKIDTFGALGV